MNDSLFDCPFNPFGTAHYDELLELDAVLYKCSLERLRQDAVDFMAFDRDVCQAMAHPSTDFGPAWLNWRLLCWDESVSPPGNAVSPPWGATRSASCVTASSGRWGTRSSSPQEAFEELERSGATILADMAGFTEDHLDEQEFSCFAVLLIRLWFALVPQGVRAPAIDVGRLADRCDKELFGFAAAMAGSPRQIERCLANSPQPDLLRANFAIVLGQAQREPLQQWLPPTAVATMLSLLKAVIEELDHLLRPRRG